MLRNETLLQNERRAYACLFREGEGYKTRPEVGGWRVCMYVCDVCGEPRQWAGLERPKSFRSRGQRTRVQYPPRRIRSPIGLNFLGLAPPPAPPPPPPTPAGARVRPLTPGGGGGFAFASVVEMVAGERDACVGSSRVGAGRLEEVLLPPPLNWCWCWFWKPEGGEGGCAGAGRV